MSLMSPGTIEIPASLGTSFDHEALEPETRCVFIAHTARDGLEVVDADPNRHLAMLPGFPEAAGVVAGKGCVLVTNRGSASLCMWPIEDPGLIQTVEPLSGASTQYIKAVGAKTTAPVEPDRPYVFSPLQSGVLNLKGA